MALGDNKLVGLSDELSIKKGMKTAPRHLSWCQPNEFVRPPVLMFLMASRQRMSANMRLTYALLRGNDGSGSIVTSRVCDRKLTVDISVIVDNDVLRASRSSAFKRSEDDRRLVQRFGFRERGNACQKWQQLGEGRHAGG